jgi:hypothetical protein
VLGIVCIRLTASVVVAALAMQEQSGSLLALGCPAAVRHGRQPCNESGEDL